MVELSVDVPAEFTDEDINGVTFAIPCDNITVWSDGYPLTDASVSGYCTQEYYSDPE